MSTQRLLVKCTILHTSCAMADCSCSAEEDTRWPTCPGSGLLHSRPLRVRLWMTRSHPIGLRSSMNWLKSGLLRGCTIVLLQMLKAQPKRWRILLPSYARTSEEQDELWSVCKKRSRNLPNTLGLVESAHTPL